MSGRDENKQVTCWIYYRKSAKRLLNDLYLLEIEMLGLIAKTQLGARAVS